MGDLISGLDVNSNSEIISRIISKKTLNDFHCDETQN